MKIVALYILAVLGLIWIGTQFRSQNIEVANLRHQFEVSQQNLAVTELALEITEYQLKHGTLPATITPFIDGTVPSYGSPGDDYFLKKYAARWPNVRLMDETPIRDEVLYPMARPYMNYAGDRFGIFINGHADDSYDLVYCRRPGAPVGKVIGRSIVFENVVLPGPLAQSRTK